MQHDDLLKNVPCVLTRCQDGGIIFIMTRCQNETLPDSNKVRPVPFEFPIHGYIRTDDIVGKCPSIKEGK